MHTNMPPPTHTHTHSVLESLLDLLADSGFIPTLFASFDCDCAREDVVQPLVHLLSQCERYSAMFVYTPQVAQIKALTAECMTQVLASLSAGCNRPRRSSSSSGSSSSKGRDSASSGTSGTSSSNGWVDVGRGTGSSSSGGGGGSFGPYLGSSPGPSSSSSSSSGGGAGGSNSYRAHKHSAQSNGGGPSVGPVDDDEHVHIIAASIRASRQTKAVLTRASELFSDKPSLAFDFLQQHGMLTKPLTPSSVAKFLRIAPSLSIEKTGAYLGELGTKNASHESGSVEFHKQVLLDYIRSFEFGGQVRAAAAAAAACVCVCMYVCVCVCVCAAAPIFILHDHANPPCSPCWMQYASSFQPFCCPKKRNR